MIHELNDSTPDQAGSILPSPLVGSGTLRQGSRDTFQKKMFQDLKTVFITQSPQYLVVSKIMMILI